MLQQGVALVLVIFLIANAAGQDMPSFMSPIVRSRAYWNMFSGSIDTYDEWLAFRGRLSNGRVVDLGDDNEVVSFGQGFNSSDYLDMYIFNLAEPRSGLMANYICRTWNNPRRLASCCHGPTCRATCSKLESLEVVVFQDTTIVGKDKLHFTKKGPREMHSDDYSCEDET